MVDVRNSVVEAIGDTPLIKLKAASERTGCTVLGKAEFMNPGQSVKDRAALFIIKDAMKRGALEPGGLIVEGTAGNTGIGLAMVGRALGFRTLIVIPETQSEEKKAAIRQAGAELIEVPAKPYRDEMNYIKYSGRLAEKLNQQEPNGAIWANQFDNVANRQAHVETTGPEIWAQTEGKVDGFICAIGSGGTLGGVHLALKERNPKVRIGLADPMGAAMYSYFTTGQLASEGGSITEGIGQGRITANLTELEVDDAFRVTDQEALDQVYGCIETEGMALGLSAGINIAGAIKLAEKMGPGHTVVTILCDYASRYASKVFNPSFLDSKELRYPDWVAAGSRPMIEA